jgi:hypothetical protein
MHTLKRLFIPALLTMLACDPADAPVAGDGDGHGAAETGSDGEDPDPGISPLLRKPEYDLFR